MRRIDANARTESTFGREKKSRRANRASARGADLPNRVRMTARYCG